jgi:hypothetical protein
MYKAKLDDYPRSGDMVLGEIRAWRLWRVADGHLCTLGRFKPVPAGPARADQPEWGGWFAFKERGPAQAYLDHIIKVSKIDGVRTFQSEVLSFWPTAARYAPDGYAIGEVELWGHVYEAERGYMAEWLCVTSLDSHWGDVDLATLRMAYNLPPVENARRSYVGPCIGGPRDGEVLSSGVAVYYVPVIDRGVGCYRFDWQRARWLWEGTDSE